MSYKFVRSSSFLTDINMQRSSCLGHVLSYCHISEIYYFSFPFSRIFPEKEIWVTNLFSKHLSTTPGSFHLDSIYPFKVVNAITGPQKSFSLGHSLSWPQIRSFRIITQYPSNSHYALEKNLSQIL